MTDKSQDGEEERTLLWDYRELWGHGIVWFVISMFIALQRENTLQASVGAVVAGTFVGCFIGYCHRSFRLGREES